MYNKWYSASAGAGASASVSASVSDHASDVTICSTGVIICCVTKCVDSCIILTMGDDPILYFLEVYGYDYEENDGDVD